MGELKEAKVVDDLDILILKELRKDGRQSYRKIAEKLNIATGTAQNRIQKMEKEKIIINYHCGIDYEKIGYGIPSIIGISVQRQRAEEVRKKLAAHKNVFAIYDVTGEFDMIIGVRFKNMKELDSFIKTELTDTAIIKSVSFLVLKTSKETHTFLNE